jgi:hypothetical protein
MRRFLELLLLQGLRRYSKKQPSRCQELLGDAVTLVIETIEKHINCFFVQALQLSPKTLRLEAQ